MKTYNSPMLHVVSIKQKDIIVTSPTVSELEGFGGYGGNASGQGADAADRFREWDY